MPDAVGKRPSPLSVRLSDSERQELERRADGEALSAYVKRQLFAEAAKPAPANNALLAQLLATLGGSRVASNVARLAQAAETGSLVADDGTTRRLIEACDDIRLMHNALMRGLGKAERAPSGHEVRARAAFAAARGGSA